jgi:hypothetical protein
LFINEEIDPDYGRNMRKLMDFLSFMERPYFVQELAVKFQIPYVDVENYLKMWENKGFLKIY